MALARLRASNPLLPEPFSTLPLSIDARSALHVFAATFAVIKRLAPFVISQLGLRMSAARERQSRDDSCCRHTTRCLDHHEQFLPPPGNASGLRDLFFSKKK